MAQARLTARHSARESAGDLPLRHQEPTPATDRTIRTTRTSRSDIGTPPRLRLEPGPPDQPAGQHDRWLAALAQQADSCSSRALSTFPIEGIVGWWEGPD